MKLTHLTSAIIGISCFFTCTTGVVANSYRGSKGIFMLPLISSTVNALENQGAISSLQSALMKVLNAVEVIENLTINVVKAVVSFVPYLLGSGSSDFCKEMNCKEPKYLVPVTQYSVVIAASPLYVSILPLNNKTEKIDNVCYSFFQLERTRLILYISIVYKDNTVEVISYEKDDIPGRLGTLRGGGPTCTFQEFAVSVQCDLTLILYRCFLHGECKEFDAQFDPEHDVFFGLSALPYQNDTCKDQHIAFIKSQPDFNTTEFIKLPQKLPYQCVTCLPHGGKAINEENLPEKDKSCVESDTTTSSKNTTELEEMFNTLQADEKEFRGGNT